jgi:hypothetical protein
LIRKRRSIKQGLTVIKAYNCQQPKKEKLFLAMLSHRVFRHFEKAPDGSTKECFE